MSYLYVSGWLRGPGKGGLGRFEFNEESGELTFLEHFGDGLSCGASFLNKEKGVLYVLVNNAQNVGLRLPSGGAIYEFHLDPETGALGEPRIVPVYVSNPCNLSIDKSGKFLVMAGHGSRNFVSKVVKGDDGEYHPAIICDDVPVMLFSLDEDGSIGKILDVVYHEGCGPLAKQQTAHPHCAMQSPLGDFFVVCDKGIDGFFSYSIDREAGKLVRNGEPIFTDTAACPRYAAFHPTLKYVYHNSETSSDVYSYSYDEDGVLTPVSVASGARFPGEEAIAAGQGRPDWGKNGPTTEGQGLDIHPSGKYMYNVTNGTNTVDVFALGDDGSMELIQSVQAGGAWPRGQLITPDGRFLLLSCSGASKIFVYSIQDDGTLVPSGHEADFENAECMSLL